MSDEVEFLSDLLSRPWSPDAKSGLQPVGLFIGKGTNALEVAVAQAAQATARSVLVETWKARKGRRAAPLLLIVLHTGSASITGATGEVPPVYEDMDVGQVERLCREALNQPDRHAALRLLSQALPSLETALPGLTNEGLLALHELEHGVPKRGDWAEAKRKARAAASIGVAAPIEGAAYGAQVFTEAREEIEKLMREDASLYERGGTAGAAQTGEEYRQTLRKALEKDEKRISRLPWKIGSGMIKGARRGVFFCAVVGSGTDLERTYLRFVPAGDNWQPEADNDAIERELGTCLRFIECEENTQLWYPDGLRESVYDF